MKRIAFILCTMFIGTIAHGDTLDINWYVDNQIYQTGTCEIGGNVTPPTAPDKYGYTFQEWLPYIPIEYLESTGTQYIDTGYVPNSSGYSAKGKLSFTNMNRGWTSPFGLMNGSVASSTTGKINQYNGTRYWSATFTGDDYSTTHLIELNTDYEFDVNFIEPDLYLKINDELVLNRTMNKRMYTGLSIWLFTPNHDNTVASGESFIGRIYYIKIYNSQHVLVRDMIPLLDGSGTPCMYDKVENKFYYNQGSGQFIAGPVIYDE